MHKKCHKCNAEREVLTFRLVSDKCPACEYTSLDARVAKLLLQVMSVFILLLGVAVLWSAFQIANQEYLHIFHDNVTVGSIRSMSGRSVSMLEAMIVSAIVGTVICGISLGMFAVATSNPVAKFVTVSRRVILVGFPFAITFIFLLLVAVPAWIFLDAQFTPTIMWTRIDLGIPDEPGQLYIRNSWFSEKQHQWEALGLRIAIMKGIAAISTGCFLIILLRPFAEKPTRRTLFGVCTSIVGIIVLISTTDTLIWWGIQNRVQSQLPRFRAALKPLLQQWPTEPGHLPEAGPYIADERLPNQLYLTSPDTYSATETFGDSVTRSPKGVVYFSLAPDYYRYFIEYHPDPLPDKDRRRAGYNLSASIRLADHWFLSKYDLILP